METSVQTFGQMIYDDDLVDELVRVPSPSSRRDTSVSTVDGVLAALEQVTALRPRLHQCSGDGHVATAFDLQVLLQHEGVHAHSEALRDPFAQ